MREERVPRFDLTADDPQLRLRQTPRKGRENMSTREHRAIEYTSFGDKPRLLDDHQLLDRRH